MAKAERLTLKYVPLSQCVEWAWERNPKKHDIGAICASIRRYGFKDPLKFEPELNGGKGGFAEGGGRTAACQAMQAQGEDPLRGIPVTKAKGWTLPVLFGVDARSEAAAEAYAVDHNNLTMAGGDFDAFGMAGLWEDDYTELLKGLAEDSELPVSVDGDDLDALLGIGEEKPEDPGPQIDKAEELRKKWDVESGQLWRLGEHRLICGDCTDEAVVVMVMDGGMAQVMATDPPYAIYGSSTGLSSDITDDRIVRPFFEGVLRLAEARLDWFGHAYICCDWRSWPSIWEMAKRTRMEPKNLLVWDKQVQGMGGNYTNTYELVGFFHKMRKQTATGKRESGVRLVEGKRNILSFQSPSAAIKEHTAQKPLELMEELIGNSSGKADIILEPFLGSGTTLIACERLGRKCRAVEIDPGYCAVAIQRWVDMTGGEPEKVDTGG